MVLCLVTLTDLQTRHAGLSASAELLVVMVTAALAQVCAVCLNVVVDMTRWQLLLGSLAVPNSFVRNV